MQTDAKGSSTSGSISRMTIPRLKGRTRSKPRTWRIEGIIALIRLASSFPRQIGREFSRAARRVCSRAVAIGRFFRSLLPLHLVAPDALDDFGVGALPAAEHL